MEVDRGDGVEEGTAGDEEGLDYHWTVVRQNHKDQLLIRNGVCRGCGNVVWESYTLRLLPSCTTQMEPQAIWTIEKRRMKQTTMGP